MPHSWDQLKSHTQVVNQSRPKRKKKWCLVNLQCCVTLKRTVKRFSYIVVQRQALPDCFRPHGLQHSRLPGPSLSFWSLLKTTELVMLSTYLILCGSRLLPSISASIRVFSNESALCIRWPKYWSFSFSINPSNEYLGLISLRIDWCDLLGV